MTSRRTISTAITNGQIFLTMSVSVIPATPAAGEQVNADRRRNEAECEVDGHYRAEMHSVDAEGLCYREEYRAENIERGVCIDKAACDNENDVDHQQEGVLISVSDRDKALACVTCKAGKGKNLAEYGCASDDKHDNGSLRNGLAPG